jgi:CDP-paratose 2-epimerase
MKKVALITGSAGLVGSEATKFFIEKGFKVVGIDSDMRKYFFGDAASTKEVQRELAKKYPKDFVPFNCDIRNFFKLSKIFVEYKNQIDVIIHCAAQPSHDWSAKDPITDFNINAVGTLNILELTRQFCKDVVVIYCSTNKVYGDRPNKLILNILDSRYEISSGRDYVSYEGINEFMSIDDSTHSVFGASKVAADIMVQEYGNYFGMRTGVFRGGCLTGEQHKGVELHGFLSYLVKCIIHNKPYVIFGDGKNVRDNLHAWDLVNMFWRYYQVPGEKAAVFNAGGGRGNDISILEAIDKINEMAGLHWNNFTFGSKRKGDHLWYITDYSKFVYDYPNWHITINLEEILKRMIDYERTVN